MMLSEKTFKSWRIDFGEKVTSSAEDMLIVRMDKIKFRHIFLWNILLTSLKIFVEAWNDFVSF